MQFIAFSPVFITDPQPTMSQLDVGVFVMDHREIDSGPLWVRHPIRGAVRHGADMRISGVEERSGFYNGAALLLDLVAMLDTTAGDLTSTQIDVKHEVPHTKDCFENPWHRSLSDCVRKRCAGDRDYRGLSRLNWSRLHVLSQDTGFCLKCASKPEDEGVHGSVVYYAHLRIFHCVGASPASWHDGFDPYIGLGREEVGAFLILFRARLGLEENARAVQCVGEVKFPKHRGHTLGSSLEGVRVEERRVVAPQSLNEIAATRVVFIGLIASPAIDGAWEVAGSEKSSHAEL